MFDRIVTVALNPSFDLTMQVAAFDFAEPIKPETELIHAGGKAVNVSRVLTALGCENICIGIGGQRNFNEFETMLANEGVCCDFYTIPGFIRENLTITDRYGKILKINRNGELIPNSALDQIYQRIAARMGNCTAVVFAGSLPLGLDVSDYQSLILRIAREYPKAKMVIDTTALSVQDYQQLQPFLIKPNLVELSAMIEKPLHTIADIISNAQAVLSMAKYVLVSLGSDGLLLCSRDGFLQVEVPHVQVRSTVGAGDTTLAGFLYALQNGHTIIQAVQFAAACGTASVMLEGTGVITFEQVESIIAQTNVIQR